MNSIKVIEEEIKFDDGSRIYYKTDIKGNVRRVIDYAAIGDYLPRYVDNAGKYYYLKMLIGYRDEAMFIYHFLEYICELTTKDYPYITEEIIKKFKGLYEDHSDVLFTVIYLAMVDLEASKMRPNWRGKEIVLESCKAVLVDNMPYRDAAELHSTKMRNM